MWGELYTEPMESKLGKWAARLEVLGSVNNADLRQACADSLALLKGGEASSEDQAHAARILEHQIYLLDNGFRALQASNKIYLETILATSREILS